jgi:quinol monooxygenase YgiN
VQEALLMGFGQPKEGADMSLDVFVRFDARPGKLKELREELGLIIEPTRAESGCIDIHLFEEIGNSGTLVIHSVWVGEEAFDGHAQLPHMKRFLGLLSNLTSNQVKALRTRQIR